MKNQKSYITIFLSGAVVMILELAGSRLLSPHFGSSIYIWTGMIGLILGFLSLGYYHGGIMADKDSSPQKLAKVLWYSAILVFCIATFKETVLIYISNLVNGNIKTGSALAISILFGPVSFLLGTVTPIIVKQKINNLQETGKDIGKLYSISTMGSIFGTFLTGYYLLPHLGHTQIIYLCSGLLFILSLWTSLEVKSIKSIIILLLIFVYLQVQSGKYLKLNTVADIDTGYSRILIRDVIINEKKSRIIANDKEGIQSAIYLDSPEEIVSDYINAFKKITVNLPRTKNALLIGGAGYIYPNTFYRHNLGDNLDIVEIDPATIDLAQKYFFLDDKTKSKIVIEDARNYIKSTTQKYDLVFLDAFNSIIPPPHLTTKEFFADIKKKITNDGVVVINMISPISGTRSDFLSWQYSTVKNVFEYTSVYKIQNHRSHNQSQNLIMIAYQSADIKAHLESKLDHQYTNLHKYLAYSDKKILTDNYAPVEHLTQRLLTNQ